jgi:hypothetical protein
MKLFRIVLSAFLLSVHAMVFAAPLTVAVAANVKFVFDELKKS